jgi:hypothetical protein
MIGVESWCSGLKEGTWPRLLASMAVLIPLQPGGEKGNIVKKTFESEHDREVCCYPRQAPR